MNTPKVSIIMPVYGVEEYIGVCVDSILTQTYDNLEVLVIDDCSQDNSINILNEHVAQSDRAFSWKIIKQQEMVDSLLLAMQESGKHPGNISSFWIATIN